jgi:PBP1b-binding outer membrane lipoprotein LpoB
MRKQKCVFAFLFIVLIISGCQTTPRIDKKQVARVEELKKQSLELIDNATEPYSKYNEKIKLVESEIAEITKSANNLKNNDVEIEQINDLIKPDGVLLGKFLSDWKASGTITQEYAAGLKITIQRQFDEILDTYKQRKGE